MSFEVVQNATKQVVAGVSTIDAVIAIGVDLHVKACWLAPTPQTFQRSCGNAHCRRQCRE